MTDARPALIRRVTGTLVEAAPHHGEGERPALPLEDGGEG